LLLGPNEERTFAQCQNGTKVFFFTFSKKESLPFPGIFFLFVHLNRAKFNHGEQTWFGHFLSLEKKIPRKIGRKGPDWKKIVRCKKVGHRLKIFHKGLWQGDRIGRLFTMYSFF
jgi:hypothetical protein